MPSGSNDTKSGWGLYWVTSDGDEDCFVVARNSRSAARVDTDYCGFGAGQVAAIRVKAIPKAVLLRWESRRRKVPHSQPLPWYADRWLLRQLGATFRERESLVETLVDDVVYTNDMDGPVPPRLIGRKYLEEFRKVRVFQRYGHDDRYTDSQMTLFSIMGICVARVQEIEHLIAHSFILGIASDKEKAKHQTIGDMVRAWKRKTFGQMLRSIEDGWEIDATIQNALKLFLENRNKLVHGLTMHEQYNINTQWGQDEMIAFLTLFELISRPLREAFRASYFASIDLGNTYLVADAPERQQTLNKRQRKQIPLFSAIFTLRRDGC